MEILVVVTVAALIWVAAGLGNNRGAPTAR